MVDVNPVKQSATKVRGMGYSFYASPSPDGSPIVFSTCQYQATGLSSGYDNAGERAKLGYELAIINIEGAEQLRLANNSRFDHYPSWSPDGNKMALIRASRRGEIYYNPRYSQLAILSGALPKVDSIVRDLAPDHVIAPYPPVWSPDSQRLAFLSAINRVALRNGATVYTVRANGKEMRRIGETTILPTWSPDGERLAFGKSEEESAYIYTVRHDGTELVEIWRSGPDGRRAAIESVAWSPDGSQILVVSNWIGVRGWLWALTPDGNENRSLIPSENRFSFRNAVWSPDGSRIAAVSWTIPDNFEDFMVVTLAPDGTDQRVLVAAHPPADDDYFSPVEIYAVNPSRPREPADSGTCSEGLVIPEPQDNLGLVHDCEALLEIRDRLAGRASLNWGPDLSILEWDGVEVEGNPARVRTIHLIDRGLTGTIPPELGQLTELKGLYLYISPGPRTNFLTGPIPPEIGGLSKLEVLDLNGNLLSGSIPEELAQLEHLRSLGISGNFLSGCIPEGLEHLTSKDTELKVCPERETNGP